MSLLYFGRFACLITVNDSEGGILLGLLERLFASHDFIGPLNCLSQLLPFADGLDHLLVLLIFLH
jgi:hypothetical protein